MDNKALTPMLAREFAMEIFSKIKPQADQEFRIFHAEAVAKTAYALSQDDKTINQEILEMAAWLHDIGYAEGEMSHAENSIKILEKENFLIPAKLADCILNHDTESIAKTNEGKILQMADKISFINPGILEILNKKNHGKLEKEELEFLDGMLSDAMLHLRNFAG